MLAWRVLNKAVPFQVWWVSDTPGLSGVPDWAYTRDVQRARDLNPYWAKRFRGYMRKVSERSECWGFTKLEG